jgi:hypothetical protein
MLLLVVPLASRKKAKRVLSMPPKEKGGVKFCQDKRVKVAKDQGSGITTAIIADHKLIGYLQNNNCGKTKAIEAMKTKGEAESNMKWEKVFDQYQALGYFTKKPIPTLDCPTKTMWIVNDQGKNAFSSINSASETSNANILKTMYGRFLSLDKKVVSDVMERVNYSMLRAYPLLVAKTGEIDDEKA